MFIPQSEVASVGVLADFVRGLGRVRGRFRLRDLFLWTYSYGASMKHFPVIPMGLLASMKHFPVIPMDLFLWGLYEAFPGYSYGLIGL